MEGRDDARCNEAAVTGGCGPPDVGTGNAQQVS